MLVSLVVATIGRNDTLPILLDSLERQTDDSFEVIVVDQNQNDDVQALLQGRKFKWSRLRSPKGASLARNAGIRHAAGEVIAFPDDDCHYSPDAIGRVRTFFEQNRCCDGVVGKWTSERCEQINKYNLFYQAGTCFFFLRRSALSRIGNFDERFGPGPNAQYLGGEDSDMLIRALRLGMVIRRDPSIVIFHPAVSFGEMDRNKIFSYAIARMALLRKHRYPLWFKCVNVAYPLVQLVSRPRAAGYYWKMFTGRLSGLIMRTGG